jgi:RecA/RadA recombinase
MPYAPAAALPATPFLPLGCARLDALFGGRGLPLRGLVELAGEAGSGKTALAMQIAVRAAAAPGRGVTLVINTEGPFPAARLLEIARAAGGGGGDALAERVRIADVPDAPALEAFVAALPHFAASAGVGLVVVDSVAAPLRADLGGAGDAPERARFLFALAAALLKLNADAGVALLVTNQVTDVFDEGGGGALAAAAAAGARALPRRAAVLSGGRWVRPALGPAWDACVTHRVLLAQTGAAGARAAYLLASPLLPPRAVAFRIAAGGCVGEGEVEALADA